MSRSLQLPLLYPFGGDAGHRSPVLPCYLNASSIYADIYRPHSSVCQALSEFPLEIISQEQRIFPSEKNLSIVSMTISGRNSSQVKTSSHTSLVKSSK